MNLQTIEIWKSRTSVPKILSPDSLRSEMIDIRTACNAKIEAQEFDNIWEISDFIEWELSQRWIMITEGVRDEITFLTLEFRWE